jgi:hypothetical protein
MEECFATVPIGYLLWMDRMIISKSGSEPVYACQQSCDRGCHFLQAASDFAEGTPALKASAFAWQTQITMSSGQTKPMSSEK